jgi:UDP-N-acetyl-D-glucosamine/UDP-N-acetyl-D-galactosamine dehydrogenase
VGGHCIGVDPYYLTFKAQSLGFHPQVILAGRRTNDGMGKYVAESMVKRMIARGCTVKGSKVGILGLTFKENVPDLRNTRVVDVIAELREYGVQVLVHDPMADPGEAHEEYGLTLSSLEDFTGLDAVVLAVSHAPYRKLTPKAVAAMFRDPKAGVVADVKAFLDGPALRKKGLDYWRL